MLKKDLLNKRKTPCERWLLTFSNSTYGSLSWREIGTVALGKGWLPCQRFWPTLAILHSCTQAPDSGWVPTLSSDPWCRRYLSPKAAHIYWAPIVCWPTLRPWHSSSPWILAALLHGSYYHLLLLLRKKQAQKGEIQLAKLDVASGLQEGCSHLWVLCSGWACGVCVCPPVHPSVRGHTERVLPFLSVD